MVRKIVNDHLAIRWSDDQSIVGEAARRAGRSVSRASGNDPLVWLAGDRCDELEVHVVVEDDQIAGLRLQGAAMIGVGDRHVGKREEALRHLPIIRRVPAA